MSEYRGVLGTGYAKPRDDAQVREVFDRRSGVPISPDKVRSDSYVAARPMGQASRRLWSP